MKMINLGYTKLGLPLHGYHFFPTRAAKNKALIIGGVHGDEPEGVVAARGLLDVFSKKFDLDLEVVVVPELNPEGVLLKTRGNSNKVDLNRNMATKDWTPVAASVRYHPGPSPMSEAENKALADFIEKFKPTVIYSLHSWKPMLNTNGELPEASAIAKITGYVIEPDIGYPTPGSLGTWAGFERNIPTLTYEIERDISFKPIIDIHVPAIIEGLKVTAKR
jgi:murein peptide amidase A